MNFVNFLTIFPCFEQKKKKYLLCNLVFVMINLYTHTGRNCKMSVGFRSSLFGFNREDVIEYIKNLHDDFSEKKAEFENQLAELECAIKQLESQKDELDSKIAEYEEKISEDTGKHSKDEVDIVLL